MRVLIVLSLFCGGAALAERPAPDRTCQCSCAEPGATPGATTDRSAVAPGDIQRSAGHDEDVSVGSDAPTTLPPRRVPRTDSDAPHIFDTPPSAPGTPGMPTTTPWRQ